MLLTPVAERVIVPLDVSTQAEAIAWIDRLPQVTFWKVGLELFVAAGSSVLTELKARQKRIFLDLKFHDIPNTMAGACRSAASYGVDFLTVHAASGATALQAAQQGAIAGATAAHVSPPHLLAITVLTSLTNQALMTDLKIFSDLPQYAVHMAKLTQQCGLAGAVCSPQEVAHLRQTCGQDFLLVCPGVRSTWAAAGDQSRTLTPLQALQAGADYLVIGRPITTAIDPAAAFATICAELEAR